MHDHRRLGRRMGLPNVFILATCLLSLGTPTGARSAPLPTAPETASSSPARVTGRVAVPPGLQPGSVRVVLHSSRAQVGGAPGCYRWTTGIPAEDGSFEIPTGCAGEGSHVLFRAPWCELEVGPLGSIPPGGTIALEGIFPRPEGEQDAPPALVPPALRPRRAGRVRFVLVSPDWFRGPLASVDLVGDFNGWSKRDGLIPLFDDGSVLTQEDEAGNEFLSGDGSPGDGVFVRVLEGLPPGPFRYGFLLNRNELVMDPLAEDFDDACPFPRCSRVEVR